MDKTLAEAGRAAGTDLERTRVGYMKIQTQRLRWYLDLFEAICGYKFTEAQGIYDKMQAQHAADMARNRQFASSMGAYFLRHFHERAINEAVQYSSAPNRIVYPIPERLKIVLDRESIGQLQGFYRREINDKQHLVSSTYRSTWDAQGFAGYRKGSVWYRIPFALDTAKLERDADGTPTLGLFIGGGEGSVTVFCNDQFVAQGRAALSRSLVIDLTGFIENGDHNLLALQFDRVGNDELGTGGLTRPSFLFTGPRVAMENQEQNRPFRILPGGIYEYIEK